MIRLPEAAVTENREHANQVTREEMEREGSADLWEAVRNVPGIIRSGGGGTDNESGFKVRGFDESRMPVFVDGVPLASPYWGDADYARLLTGDLEGVDIEKGYGSMLLGANTMGGAVLLRTAKPKKPLEASLTTTWDFDSIFKYGGSLNTVGIGTKQDLFYGKAVFQYRDIDHYRLSEGFIPYDQNPQGTGDRLYSDSRDTKLTLLAGWTPKERFGLNMRYGYQDADKGVSPPSVKGQVFRTDTWPVWTRHTVSLDGTYTGEGWYTKALSYFDKYDTALIQENSLLCTRTDNDDYGLGVRLEGGYDFNSWNTLKAALNFKQENHRGTADGIDKMDITENTWSGGTEYAINPWKPLTFTAGLGFDILQPASFWTITDLAQTEVRYMFSWQAGVFYAITKNHEVRFTYAKKNHVPTMGQRYEEIRQDAIPNPDLKNETAYHYEFGYRGIFAFDINTIFKPVINLDAAVYYADLVDMIAEGNVTTSTGGITKVRMNIDKVAYYGFELGFGLDLCKYFALGSTLSVNRYDVKSNTDGFHVEGNFPRTTANIYMVIKPLKSLSIIPSLEYEGPRYGHLNIINVGNPLDRYALFSLKVSADITEYCTLSFSGDNLLDTGYALDDPYLPLGGRSYTFSVTGKY
ncbi:TonB-dependent receptor [Spirochaetia bacterium]|nr:TonB-dependent receptor [Spirochaetia bacterium]